ncbi:voltage-dependent calcium channel gamma-like subunit [Ascaphus truei]|uniref:voltage-dependent calcium channel gamma-like subunit n=1 Tax=Ascaphus truei TaxID=8439 RepID=UPI003F59A394
MASGVAVQVQRAWSPSGRFFETFLRVLITLSSATALVLSSIAVCDGQWLSVQGKLVPLWQYCRTGAEPQCSPAVTLAAVAELRRGFVAVRSAVALAIVVAIVGLHLLIVSQVCEDGHSHKKWSMGSVLLLVSFLLSSAGTVTYVILLSGYVTLCAFTLSFWCQIVGGFLFFLNGMSGLTLGAPHACHSSLS